MKNKILIFLFLLICGKITFSKITVFTIGDSTMAEKSLTSTERGWGMLLPTFVNPDSVIISNNGFNGRSTKSFINEGRWTTVLNQLKAGDFVFIQFGHNDEKLDTYLHTDPYTTFSQNLEKFIIETRAKGATPILLTPIVRRSFDNKGFLTDTHGEYPDAIRKVSGDMNVPLIDMELKTRLLENIAGLEGSRKFHEWFPPKEIDNTHLCNYGAYVVARMCAEDIQALNIAVPLNNVPSPLKNANESTYKLAYTMLNKDIQDEIRVSFTSKKDAIYAITSEWPGGETKAPSFSFVLKELSTQKLGRKVTSIELFGLKKSNLALLCILLKD